MAKNAIANLSAYIQNVGTAAAEVATKALKEQIDIDANNYYEFLKDNAPTQSLANAVKMTKYESGTRYGYVISFEGDSYSGRTAGMSYEQIARWFNNGTYRISPTYFITRATRRLKGLDNRAYYRFQIELSKSLKEG